MQDKVVHRDRSDDDGVGRGYLGLEAHKTILSLVEWRHGFCVRGLPPSAGMAVACDSDHHAETSMDPGFYPNERIAEIAIPRLCLC